MKTAPVEDLHRCTADLIDSDAPVIVTRDGKNAALLYPLRDPNKIPIEIRRKLFREISESIGRELDVQGVTDEEIEQDFAEFKKRRRGQ